MCTSLDVDGSSPSDAVPSSRGTLLPLTFFSKSSIRSNARSSQVAAAKNVIFGGKLKFVRVNRLWIYVE